MALREIASIAELKTLVGQEVAVSEWLEITQQRIDAFADATGDHQWIHVDTERCTRESPFGTTIAHGYLTLSLLPRFSAQTVAVGEPLKMMINYGLNKLRFPNPVRRGSRVRCHYVLREVADVKGGWQAAWQVTVEIEGQSKPACVAETLTRYYAPDPE